MFRDDDIARTERASQLIDEIAKLERQKLEQSTTDQRLEAARSELSSLQSTTTAAPPRHPGFGVHLVVFAMAAMVAFLGYKLLL